MKKLYINSNIGIPATSHIIYIYILTLNNGQGKTPNHARDSLEDTCAVQKIV